MNNIWIVSQDGDTIIDAHKIDIVKYEYYANEDAESIAQNIYWKVMDNSYNYGSTKKANQEAYKQMNEYLAAQELKTEYHIKVNDAVVVGKYDSYLSAQNMHNNIKLAIIDRRNYITIK